MTSKVLIQKIYIRLGKFKIVVLLAGICMAIAAYFYCKSIPTVYTARASVFPLTTASENSGASNALSQLLGGGESAKSLSQEASINIVELATSRNTREAVAMLRLPQFGNKTVAQLLIENHNKYKKFYASSIAMPKDTVMLAAVGGGLLNANFTAKTAKSGILEITFSNTNQELLSPVTYAMIDKISQFYIDLKIKKAKRDYDFTIAKLDSVQLVLNTFDRQAINMANTTRFVPKDRIEFSIPKENLVNAKERSMRQRDALANNKEEATWRLQKATPIIATLDKPERPFLPTTPSTTLYVIFGFILGTILTVGLLITPLLFKYIESETQNAIFGNDEDLKVNETVTTTATTV